MNNNGNIETLGHYHDTAQRKRVLEVDGWGEVSPGKWHSEGGMRDENEPATGRGGERTL